MKFDNASLVEMPFVLDPNFSVSFSKLLSSLSCRHIVAGINSELLLVFALGFYTTNIK